ncbi:double-stranded RNA-specific editase 1-like [Anopheles maculipalpis]|uniref:double-stranded RNA-specific editase 1-like n=1 Tax=Anopheles maculipalpis TaxID=1496333 RepID=UPI0021596392|nr:double-stranded RNA-specific editase 1-like [Anopheles maculipalpis]
MQATGDIAAPDGSLQPSSDPVTAGTINQTVPCIENFNEQFFKYRNPPTPDVCSEFSDVSMEESASYGSSVAGSSVSTRKSTTDIDRRYCAKTRKARQLCRYRKWLIPKNAIVALNEMQGDKAPQFTVNTVGTETKVELYINNVKYAVTERNKNLAKAKVSELALRDLIFTQITNLDASSQGLQRNQVEELPMEHLASFAIHKLLDEWKKDGFVLPESLFGPQRKAPISSNDIGYPKTVRTIDNLPPEASSHHPTKLFCFMRPQTTFKDLGWNGDLINPEFSAGLLVDGQYFTGTGRSKKLARKAAAANACKVLFGVVFDASVMCEQAHTGGQEC